MVDRRSGAVALAALAVFASFAAAPATAQRPPGEAYAVRLEYEFTVGGARVFRAGGDLRIDGARYLVDTDFNKEGLAAAFSSTFNGRNRAWGTFVPGGVSPASGWSWIQFKSKVRTWLVGYTGAGSFSETHEPQLAVKTHKAVTPEQKNGAFDPLTATLTAVFTGASACDRTYPIFDSKRRFDVTLSRLRTETVKPTEIPAARGEAVVCAARMTRIAGYDDDDLRKNAYEKDPPKLWLATVDGLDRPIPVKMEMATSFGVVHGRLKSVTRRALSPEDRVALGAPR
ncbi:MAG: DUF3108 domain-containing protein [Rhodospirillales bacterium]|nr:MAG: DUF3108 domain-containing protein [Rhodospirillales bacterium]